MSKLVANMCIGIGVGCLALVIYGVRELVRQNPRITDQDVQMVREKYGCTPTNAFVGKNADRLWLCNDGLKYKEIAFRYWAQDERRK